MDGTGLDAGSLSGEISRAYERLAVTRRELRPWFRASVDQDRASQAQQAVLETGEWTGEVRQVARDGREIIAELLDRNPHLVAGHFVVRHFIAADLLDRAGRRGHGAHRPRLKRRRRAASAFRRRAARPTRRPSSRAT